MRVYINASGGGEELMPWPLAWLWFSMWMKFRLGKAACAIVTGYWLAVGCWPPPATNCRQCPAVGCSLHAIVCLLVLPAPLAAHAPEMPPPPPRLLLPASYSSKCLSSLVVRQLRNKLFFTAALKSPLPSSLIKMSSVLP